jgi:hypothetical protein
LLLGGDFHSKFRYAADFTDTSLLKKYRPEIYDLPTTNGPHCTGDGIKMTLAVGGNTLHMDKGMFIN